MTWINALLIYFYVLLAGVALTNTQTCRNTGSLDYQDGTLIVLATTYVIPSYRIPCDGVVVGWEFCYQILNVPSVTFYPSVWRWNGNDRYTLVHVSTVTYVPQLGGVVFICDNYTLPADQQISVLTNDTIGLYTTTRSHILNTNESNDTLAYSAEGNQSSIIITGDDGFVTQRRFHLAISAGIRSTVTTSNSRTTTILQTASIITTSSTSSTATSTSTIQVLSTTMSMTSTSMTSTSMSSTSTLLNLITTSTLLNLITTSTLLNLITTSTTSTPLPLVISTSTVSTSAESVLITSINPTTPSTSMTPAGAAGGTSDSNNTSVIIGAAVGVAVAILVALIIVLVFVVVVYKRRTSTSASYAIEYLTINSTSPMRPQLMSGDADAKNVMYAGSALPGAVAIKPQTIDNPKHLQANAHKQPKSSGDYETIEMFIFCEKHTSDQCKTLKSQYYSTLGRIVEPSSLDSEIYDTPMTDSASISRSHEVTSSHISYYNHSTNSANTNQLYEEPLYEDPGHKEDNIYSWLKCRNITTMKPHHIKLDNVLGSGHFGVVNLGTWTDGSADPVQVAVKTLNSKCSESDRVKFLREAAIMGQFQHHNIVQLHGVVTEEENMMIVLEYLPKGDLQNNLLNLQQNVVPEMGHELLSYCRQIASGLEYLSKKHFVHRDLAARNILLSDDYICKIADFGMARDVSEDYYITSGSQIPIKWTAPEALYFRKYSVQSDVWSYGCVLYEIWSIGHRPFEEFTGTEYLEKIMIGYRLPPPPGCPREIYHIMIQCWHPDPKARPSSEALVRMLLKSDRFLLHWSDEDKMVASEATILGKPLSFGEQLYEDLQKLHVDT